MSKADKTPPTPAIEPQVRHFSTETGPMPTSAIGMYDPQFEKDSCGVGVVVAVDGKPLEHKVGDVMVPMTTPAIVLLQREPVQLVATREGFEPRTFVLDPKTGPQFDVVLEVLADRRVTFDVPVQTGVAVGEGWIEPAEGNAGGDRDDLGRVHGIGADHRVPDGLAGGDDSVRHGIDEVQRVV